MTSFVQRRANGEQSFLSKKYCKRKTELSSGPLASADAYSGVTSCSGIFIFAVDAAAFQPLADYERALAKTIGRIKAVPPSLGFEEVLMPDEPEARSCAKRERNGISIPEDTWQASVNVGAQLGVNVEAVVRPDPDPFPAGAMVL